LISSETVRFPMLYATEQFEISKIVYFLIAIPVMNLISVWNRTVRFYPHRTMQVFSIARCFGVVPVFSTRKLSATPFNYRLQIGLSHFDAATREDFVHRLASHRELFGYISKRKTGFIKFDRSRVILPRCWHLYAPFINFAGGDMPLGDQVAQPLRGVWVDLVVVRTGHFSLKKSRPCWHG
jgi:hypothetical protein